MSNFKELYEANGFRMDIEGEGRESDNSLQVSGDHTCFVHVWFGRFTRQAQSKLALLSSQSLSLMGQYLAPFLVLSDPADCHSRGLAVRKYLRELWDRTNCIVPGWAPGQSPWQLAAQPNTSTKHATNVDRAYSM